MASMEVGSPATCQSQIARPLSNFGPSCWGDSFTSLSFDSRIFEMYAKEVEVLKEEVTSMLGAKGSRATEKMNLINTLERLGVSYHFEKEIEEQLKQLFSAYDHNEDHDLNTVALHFRLFRQHGHNMSCDVFNKFKYSNGKFKETLTKDVMGMLSLYEASPLRIHGEDILDEAFEFTTAHLESMAANSSPFHAKQVMHALKQPLHRGIPRMEARHYISVYQEDPSRNELLLKLAKLDFNLVQLMHKQELSHMSRWFKDLDFEARLPYARNRVVECYLWAMATYFEPHYSFARIMLAKTITMASIVDDTFDSFGTLEELQPFNIAVQRWDPSAINQLPEYMKLIYKNLLALFEEFEMQMAKQGRSYSVYHTKESFKELVKNYYIEAKWVQEGYVPSFDKYIVNALMTCGYCLLTTSSFMGMSEVAIAETFEWLSNKPKILLASCTINRLMDDIVDHEEEQKRGHGLTVIRCYMEQYGVSKEEAIEEFNMRIENAWKDINEELFKPNSISKHLFMRVLNLARVIDVFFKHDEGYTKSETVLKDNIISLFIDPITI